MVVFSMVGRAGGMTADAIKAVCDGLPNKTIVIGMVTKGNVELTLQRWRPTFEDYLTSAMADFGYGCRTRLVPLGFDDYEEHTANKSIDIIFPNPTAFQEMQDQYDVHPFLSVTRKFSGNQRLDRFGGVIVRSATRFQDVIEVGDIKKHPGIKVCAVNSKAFGGWQIQWYEMIMAGIDVSTDVQLEFLGNHETCIEQTVLSQNCDIGMARTETIERLVGIGRFNDSDVFTLSEKGPESGFPQHLSTQLYPEWPLASLAHAPREIEQILAVALLNLKPESPEAEAGDFYGFAFPYSYKPVKDMFIAIDKDGTGQCYPGHFREGSNPGMCLPCPAGSFSRKGLGDCVLCPIGTVNNGTANVHCDFCADGLTTLEEGSVEGFCTEMLLEEVPWLAIVVSIIAALTVLVVVLGFMAARRAYERYKDALRAAREEEQGKRNRLRNAINVMQKFDFPLCIVRFTDFVEEGRLVSHEEARGKGILIWFDRWVDAIAFAEKSAIVFNSHQWLAVESPDPNNTHFNSMCDASRALCETHNLQSDELFIWVDYSSIPQVCDASKYAAIRSIMVYASCCRFFVAVTPDAVHVNRQDKCGEHSYRRRGWCRLEQWAFWITGGVETMYVFDSNSSLCPVSRRKGWLGDMINVMDADFTFESDKYVLVDIILGLYGFALINERTFIRKRVSLEDSEGSGSNLSVSVRKTGSLSSSIDITSGSNTVFPRKYFDGLNHRLEQEVDKMFRSDGDLLFDAEETKRLIDASEAFTRIHESWTNAPENGTPVLEKTTGPRQVPA
jgi:hypothetical protein